MQTVWSGGALFLSLLPSLAVAFAPPCALSCQSHAATKAALPSAASPVAFGGRRGASPPLSLRMEEAGGSDDQPKGTSGVDRRSFAAGIASAAVLLTGSKANALQWQTVEKIAQDPSLLMAGIDPERITKIKQAFKRNSIGVQPANAAEYTVEFDEFKAKVQKAGKAKIGGVVVDNPSEDQLLEAWKAEEKRRADQRAKEGKEPLTRATKQLKPGTKDQYDVKYFPPVVTNTSVPEAIALGKFLKETGAKMYGAYWCTHCYDQKQVLGYEVTDKYLEYVECDKKGANGNRDFCKERKVKGFPTWEVNGELYPGQLDIPTLAGLVGFDLKTGKKSEKGQVKPPPIDLD